MGNVFRQAVEVGIRVRLSQDGRIPKGSFAAPFPIQGAGNDDGPTVRPPLTDNPIQEGHEVLWQPNGNLPAHPVTVPDRDACRQREKAGCASAVAHKVALMRTLVLGGTSFVGRAIVEDALDRGDEVTIFTRGQTGPALFPGVERRIGDRSSGNYSALAAGSWDAVVDVSGYVPRHVGQAANALGDRIGRYLFISTGSVYGRLGGPDAIAEDAPRLPSERDTEEITGDTYGPLKVACEDDVLARYGEQGTVVRPGIVAGPHDPTDRFTWWVRRAARGGRVALPARPDQPAQVVDSRDLARLVTSLLADDRPGVYNAVGPAEPTTLAGLVHACAAGAGTTIAVVPVLPDAVRPTLPLVLTDSTWDVIFRRSAVKARAAGLPATPLATTAADVLAWDRERGQPPLGVELAPEREAELLAAAG